MHKYCGVQQESELNNSKGMSFLTVPHLVSYNSSKIDLKSSMTALKISSTAADLLAVRNTISISKGKFYTFCILYKIFAYLFEYCSMS